MRSHSGLWEWTHFFYQGLNKNSIKIVEKEHRLWFYENERLRDIFGPKKVGVIRG